MTTWVIRKRFIDIVVLLVDISLLKANNDMEYHYKYHTKYYTSLSNDRHYLPRALFY